MTYVSADIIRTMNDDGTTSSYKLAKFQRSNQTTCYNQVPLIHDGERVEAGTVLADGPATQKGEMALGKNLLIAFMPWNGYNYEDAVIISQRLVQDDTLSSIHIEEYEIDARETKLGAEEITRDLPNVGEDAVANLDERGIIRIGAEVEAGDILGRQGHPEGRDRADSGRSACCAPSSVRRAAKCVTPRCACLTARPAPSSRSRKSPARTPRKTATNCRTA